MGHLDHDADYTEQVSVYLNRRTGELFSVYEDDECLEAVDPFLNEQARLTVQSHPADFIHIPLPDHSKMHQWFQEFLRSIGRESEYSGSIGRWVESTNIEDDRHAWANFRSDRVCEHLKSHAAKAGLEVVIE